MVGTTEGSKWRTRAAAARAARGARAAAAIGALLAGGLLAGCGKQGDPAPPLRVIPAETTELVAAQRGDQLVLRFPFPATTTSGARLPGLSAVEVWQLTRPVTDPANLPIVGGPEMAAAAQLLATLSGPELQSAISGDAVVVRLPLPAPATPPAMHAFAVKTTAQGGETSGWSNVVRLLPRVPPAPPADLAVTARAGGIELAWSPAADGGAGYVVYRRPAESRAYGEPLVTLPAEARGHLDTTAVYGTRYIYTVTSLAAQEPRAESGFAGEREVDYQDRFAPAPPQDVVALPREGGMELVWKPSVDTDVAGYHVYRRDPDADYRRLTTAPVAELKYSDSGLAAGLLYTYRVTAVDQSGNEGAPAPDAEARPR
jgi:hypothetical protein